MEVAAHQHHRVKALLSSQSQVPARTEQSVSILMRIGYREDCGYRFSNMD